MKRCKRKLEEGSDAERINVLQNGGWGWLGSSSGNVSQCWDLWSLSQLTDSTGESRRGRTIFRAELRFSLRQWALRFFFGGVDSFERHLRIWLKSQTYSQETAYKHTYAQKLYTMYSTEWKIDFFSETKCKINFYK